MRVLHQVASFLYVALVAYLLWRGAIPVVDMMAGRGGGALGAALPQHVPSAPPLITWTFGVLALAAGLGALALALWFAFSDRIAAWSEGDGSAALLPWPPSRRAWRTCAPSPTRAGPSSGATRRFERVAAASGVDRQPWLTPMEFMREALSAAARCRATAVPA